MAKKANGKFYGTGRRKSSIARVYLVPGTGNITINKRSLDEYFGLETLKVVVKQPLALTETADKFDVIVNVHGGGYTGQAGAIRHGISRALLQVDSDEYRPSLKKAGFLTRDPRMKERKKYGLKAAKRNIPHNSVKEAVRYIHFFKSLCHYGRFLIKLLCNSCRNLIKLHTVNLCISHRLRQHTDKVTNTAGRF